VPPGGGGGRGLSRAHAHRWVDAPSSSGSTAGLYLRASSRTEDWQWFAAQPLQDAAGSRTPVAAHFFSHDGDALLHIFYPHKAVVTTPGPSVWMAPQLLPASRCISTVVGSDDSRSVHGDGSAVEGPTSCMYSCKVDVAIPPLPLFTGAYAIPMVAVSLLS
jgi:hypothetical protein